MKTAEAGGDSTAGAAKEGNESREASFGPFTAHVTQVATAKICRTTRISFNLN